MTFNPWGFENNLEELINTQKEINIIGPISNITKERHIITLKIDKNDNEISLKSNLDSKTGLRFLYIKIKDDIGVLENISRSDIYYGTEYIILGLQLLYLLNIKISTLIDDSYFICDFRDNFFFKKSELEPYKKIPYKMISLFRFGNTFYMKFGYKPMSIEYDNKNKKIYKDESNAVYILLDNLYKIGWNEIDDILKNGIKMINECKEIKNNKNWRVIDQNKWIKYWNTIYNSWTHFKMKYYDETEFQYTPFRSFIMYDKNDCALFCDWLELYSHTYMNFMNINTYVFNNQIQEIPGIKDFSKLKILLNSCKWINNDVHSTPFKINIF